MRDKWIRFKKNFLVEFFGWNWAHLIYPKIGQKCRVYGFDETFTYCVPDEATMLPGCRTEQEKREWYIFLRDDNALLYAFDLIWKPVRGSK